MRFDWQQLKVQRGDSGGGGGGGVVVISSDGNW